VSICIRFETFLRVILQEGWRDYEGKQALAIELYQLNRGKKGKRGLAALANVSSSWGSPFGMVLAAFEIVEEGNKRGVPLHFLALCSVGRTVIHKSRLACALHTLRGANLTHSLCAARSERRPAQIALPLEICLITCASDCEQIESWCA